MAQGAKRPRNWANGPEWPHPTGLLERLGESDGIGPRCRALLNAFGAGFPLMWIAVDASCGRGDWVPGYGDKTPMSKADYAEVAIKPPLLFLGALVLGSVLTLFLPIGPGLASPNALGLAVGIIFLLLGFALAFFSVRALFRAGTNVVPGEPATALVIRTWNNLFRA